MCVQSAAKGESDRNNKTPVHIYGPPGLAQFIATLLHASDTFIMVPVVVFELVAGPVPDEERTPKCINKRAKLHVVWLCKYNRVLGPRCLPSALACSVLCLWSLQFDAPHSTTVVQVRVPADRFNPDGFTSASLMDTENLAKKWDKAAPVTRHELDRVAKQDERQNHRPPALPGPGDPNAAAAPQSQLTWTLSCDHNWKVCAGEPSLFRSPQGGSSCVYVSACVGCPDIPGLQPCHKGGQDGRRESTMTSVPTAST